MVTWTCSVFATLLAVQCPILGGCPTALAECMSGDCGDYRQTHTGPLGHRPTITDGAIPTAPQLGQQYPPPHRIPGEPAEAHSSGRQIHSSTRIRSWRKPRTEPCALAAPSAGRARRRLSLPSPPPPPHRPDEEPRLGESLHLRATPFPTHPLAQGSHQPSPTLHGHLCPSRLLSPLQQTCFGHP